MVVLVNFIGSPPESGIHGRNPPPDWKNLSQRIELVRSDMGLSAGLRVRGRSDKRGGRPSMASERSPAASVSPAALGAAAYWRCRANDRSNMMNRFRATRTFWRALRKLTSQQQQKTIYVIHVYHLIPTGCPPLWPGDGRPHRQERGLSGGCLASSLSPPGRKLPAFVPPPLVTCSH